MSDDSLIDSTEQDKRKRMALGVSGVLVALQLMLLLTYRNYLDFGNLILTIVFIVTSLIVFWSLRKARIIPAIVGVVLATLVLYAHIAKVQWNEAYLQGLTTPQAFVLEDYIDEYPSLEGYLFSGLLGKPDWVRYARDCMEPALRDRPVLAQCRTAALINKNYNINIDRLLHDYLRRMQTTAMDVQNERIRSGGQYQECIAQKRCAPIPLLPEAANPDEVAEDASQYTEIRQAFWDLAEQRGLTIPVCQAMSLCVALVKTGILDPHQTQDAGE